jgi:hypothetical protein
MEVFQDYPEQNSGVVAQTHLFTQMYWADAELVNGQCREAWSHFDSARSYFLQLKLPGLFGPQFAALKTRIDAGCGRKLERVKRAEGAGFWTPK